MGQHDLLRVLERARAAAEARELDPAYSRYLANQAAEEALAEAEWPYRSSGIAQYLRADDLASLVAKSLRATQARSLISSWARQALNPSSRHERWGKWLWISGPCGTGKTVAAAEAISIICPRWSSTRRARYVPFRALIDATRSRRSWSQQERESAEEISDFSANGYLVVVDEVGQELESEKDLARVALHDFVDKRQKNSGLTLFLSNKSSDELRERFASEWYDPRTESRLRALLTRAPDGSGFRNIQGEDMRGRPI